MKILLLSWRGPGHPNAGGAEISTYEHARGWVKKGHQVTWFTSAYPGARKHEVIDGIEFIRAGRQVFGVQFEAFKWYLFGDHEKFDLVVDQFHGIPFFTPLYVRRKKLAFIHEVTKEVWHLNPWSWPLSLIPATLGSLFEPFIFKLFYSNIPFMTVSESTKNDLTTWGVPKDNITVVHNGINTYLFKELPKKETKRTALFLGSISKDKGIEDALKIFVNINAVQSDWQFWVVGKSDRRYLNRLKDLARELGIIKKVKFWGFVSERLKFELLAKAHILINPSIREGWGLVVIEAALVGTPTVAYDVPGLRDAIVNGKTGILCQKDISKVTTAVLSLISDRELYERMVQECRKWASSFDWRKSSEESLNLILKLSGSKL